MPRWSGLQTPIFIANSNLRGQGIPRRFTGTPLARVIRERLGGRTEVAPHDSGSASEKWTRGSHPNSLSNMWMRFLPTFPWPDALGPSR